MEFVDLFNGLEITDRKIAVSFIKNYYANKNKNLIQSLPYSIRKINFKCIFTDCIFRICCKKSLAKDSLVKSYVVDTTTNC